MTEPYPCWTIKVVVGPDGTVHSVSTDMGDMPLEEQAKIIHAAAAMLEEE